MFDNIFCVISALVLTGVTLKKLGIFVGENENWTFFKEIFEEFSSHYQVDRFRRKTGKTPLLPRRLN
ncbi:MAG: hypothetical protein AB1798_23815, partial [Spirochaetota bacterium]